jgi:hypothetical protein
VERDKPKKSESFGHILPQLPWKPKRGDLKDFWIPFGVAKIQNGGRCHGNQGAKNVKFTPDSNNFCSNVSCHIHI